MTVMEIANAQREFEQIIELIKAKRLAANELRAAANELLRNAEGLEVDCEALHARAKEATETLWGAKQ